MPEQTKPEDAAADQRPVPSQAEGDEETIDKALEEQETKEQEQKSKRR